MNTISVSEIRKIRPVGIRGIKLSQKEKENQLFGVIEIGGVEHHVALLKHEEGNDDWGHYLPIDFKKQYAGNLEIDPSGNFRTVHVPGYGDYICVITPLQNQKA